MIGASRRRGWGIATAGWPEPVGQSGGDDSTGTGEPSMALRMGRTGRRGLARLLAPMMAAAALAATVVVAGTAAPASAAPLNYVALGDSYTAGAGILPLSSTISPLCLQTTLNYPHLIAHADGFDLQDVSCSGATSGDMTSSQYPGVAPQFDALSGSTSVVTVGIGGNDNNLFVGALVDCGVTDILDFLNIGSPCKDIYGNTFANDVSGDASTIGGVLQGVHARSPQAQVFVVGYPDLLPQLSLIHISEPTRRTPISYAVFCLKKK